VKYKNDQNLQNKVEFKHFRMLNYKFVKALAHFLVILCVLQSIAILAITLDWYVNRLRNNEPKESVFKSFSNGDAQQVSAKELFEKRLQTVSICA